MITKISLSDILIAVVIVVIGGGQLVGIADDPGLGWHLATGEWISGARSIPRADPFLWSPHPRPWVANQWASDLLFYLTKSVGEWPLLYLLILTVFFATYLCALFEFLRRETELGVTSLIVTVLACKLAQVHLIVRPTVFSAAFFLALYIILYRVNRPESEDRLRDLLLRVFVLFVLWANLHPGFLMGVALLALHAILAVVTGGGVRAFLLLFSAILASLVNPYGARLYSSALELMGSEYFMRLNTEWQPLAWGSYEGALFIALCAISVIGLCGFRHSLKGPYLFVVISWLVIACMALRSVRMLPYLAVVTALPATWGVVALARARYWSRFSLLARLFNELERRERFATGGKVVLALYLFAASISLILLKQLPGFSGEYGPRRSVFPYESLEWLGAELAAGRAGEAVILSHPDWGGFITWQGLREGESPRLRAVIDDRNELLGEEFYRRFFAAVTPVPGMGERVRSFGADYLLLPESSRAARYLLESGELVVLHRAGVGVLFGVGGEVSLPQSNLDG